jgi:hypothetical protein
MVGSMKFGEAVGISQQELKKSIWVLPCAFAQSELLKTFYSLKNGAVTLPGHKDRHEIRICALEKLGGLGPDPRDVYDGFALTDAKTAYPALWGHPAELATFAQKPNQYLDPLSEALPGRNLRDIELVWPKAGRVLITMRSWLKTKRMVAVRMSEPVLSDVWWPFVFKDGSFNETQAEKALVLWLNSTLGILMLLAHREETRGAWVQFKKPVLSAMPVLDLTRLSSRTLGKLADAYDSLHAAMLLPLPQMGTDPTRMRIDAAICRALKLPSIDAIRQLLGQEPLITLDIRPLVGV